MAAFLFPPTVLLAGSSAPDPPDYVLDLAARDGITEERIRSRLRGNVVQTIQLLAHFKRNNSALRQDQLVSVLAYYLRVSQKI